MKKKGRKVMKWVLIIAILLAGCNSPADGDYPAFKVKFPATPSHDVSHSTFASGRLKAETHFYQVKASDALYYVSYVEFSPPPGPDLKPVDVLNATLQAALLKNQGVDHSAQSSIVNGMPTMTVRMTCKGGMSMDGRFIYQSPRVYQVAVVHPTEREPAAMRGFLESFTIRE